MQLILVDSMDKGIERAKDALYDQVDNKTVLFLSGGRTPRQLYEVLAKEKVIKPAAVGMSDERFGKPMHENSNEKMVQDSGLLPYLESKKIPFYSMLYEGIDRVQAAKAYDEEVRDLFFKFPKSVGILGIGTDGHTASIMPNREDFIDPLFDPARKYLYVSEINDPKKYGERLTMTFAGLSLLDYVIVFVFGSDKKEAMKKIFTPGSLEEIPGRFFHEPDIAKKTLFITDQKV